MKNSHSTLAELGLDSLMAAEVQHTLSREYNITLNSNRDIKNLTTDDINAIAKGKKDAIIHVVIETPDPQFLL